MYIAESHSDEEYIDDISLDDEQPEDESSLEERAILKYGYPCLFAERAPVNDNHINCHSPESAILFHIEDEYLKIPKNLGFNRIKKSIPIEHRERIESVWQNVTKHKRKMNSATRVLRKTWKKPPKGIDYTEARTFTEKTPLTIRKKYRNGALALISRPATQSKGKSESLEDWQTTERAIRRDLYANFTNYLTSLRAYYEMLLENEDDQFILPKNHEQRSEIASRNRFLRYIHTFHAIAEGAKAAHHEQGGKKIRWGERIPYVAHSMRVAAAGMYDALSQSEENEDTFEIELITLIIADLIHDVLEDTDLTIDQIMEKVVKNSIDKIDSTLIQKIKPGFKLKFYEKAKKMKDENSNPLSEDEIQKKVNELFQEKVIKLITSTREQALRQILRILSKNNPLSEKQKRKACTNNIAGKDKTMKLLNIEEKDLKRWGIITRLEIEQDNDVTGETIDNETTETGMIKTSINTLSPSASSKTFTECDEEYDNGKMALFLLRLTSIADSDAKRRSSLLVKLRDRADNIATQQNMSIGLQLGNLRAATTRLLAWCMYDHDSKNYPMHNSVYRLITVCLSEYERIKKENSYLYEEMIDGPCVGRLQRWKDEIKPLTSPSIYQDKVIDFEKAKEAANKKEAKSLRRKQWANKWSGGLLYKQAA